MGKYIATEVVKKIIRAGKNVLNSRVLVMGATFKENVSDITELQSGRCFA